MTDELATALIIIVTAFITIAAGFAWWANRPQRSRYENAPRIQPLFPGEAVGAVVGGVDEVDDLLPGMAASESEAAAGPREPSRSFAPIEGTQDTTEDAASGGRAEPSLPSWESAASRAQRNSAQQAAMGDRSATGGRDLSRGAGSPSAWAGGGLRQEAAHAMPRRVPMQPHFERSADRHGERPAERHVERYADRQPERFAQGLGGGRQVRAGEWGAGGGSSTMRSPIAPDGWNDGESVRFSVPSDGTLQFLPGRLEITAGQAAGREIRFVRLPNTEPEITFGRNEGAPYRHVQLRDGTVSRLHARMRLHDGRWTLTNLSTTNPVTYNGRVLGDGEEQPLEQDDRIEMGEVAFRFRSR